MGRVFFPQYRKAREGVPLFEGTLLEHATRAGLVIASECGGQGTCGRCVVRLLAPAVEKVVRIGNGGIAGARLMLVSQAMRRTAEDLARRIQHVKPNGREPDFPYMVAEKMCF